MKAWPYKQECKGHDPAKKNYCTDEACSFGMVCTNPLLWTVQCIKSKMDQIRRNNTQAVAGMNSQIRISESTDSEQHDESDKEAKRVTRRKETRKNKHPKKKCRRYRSSSVTPDSQPNVLSLVRGIRKLHLCRRPVTLFLTLKRQPIAKFLTAGLLLLSDASFC